MKVRTAVTVRELGLGDVIELEESDHIFADARLVSSQSFYVNVSILTGESMLVPWSSDVVTTEKMRPSDAWIKVQIRVQELTEDRELNNV